MVATPVDHSALIEQLEGWARRLEISRRHDPPAAQEAVMSHVTEEMRQVADDLAREDATAVGEASR